MRTTPTLLLVTGTLFLGGCTLLIDAQLDAKGSSSAGGAGGGSGAGGASGGAVASSSSTLSSSSSTASSSSSSSADASAGATASASSGAPQSSSASGGGCGSGCMLANATSDCVAGACVITSCDGNFGDCDLKPETGCETNLNKDPEHCGSCAHSCGGAKCAGSKCK